MSNFLMLVHNENMKIYRRVRTWVMLGIIIVMSILIPYLLSSTGGGASTHYWEGAMLTVSFISFLNTIFAVVIAADSVAGEFSWGTIKLLLIRPWTRSKILASKYVSVLLFSLLTTLLMTGLSLLTSSVLMSTEPVVSEMPGDYTPAGYALVSWLYEYVDLFITLAIAFMVSTVFRSGALAIGLSLFILFTQGIFGLIFDPERYSWAKYILFTNMDLSQYMFGSSDSVMSLGFSITVLVVYYVLFMGIAWYVFHKRDVAA
ncbi:ABC transporter permease [Paenibacillus shunpengii]|uniref:ABC transporter permease n=1 Tax=Paenibacillus shunpengii TaxID=2054424 RepID=A0ABW5SJP4_9BACL